MRASLFKLNGPATIFSLWLYSGNPGTNVMTGIYSGSVSNIGSLQVSSSPQTMVNGWNGFPITPTYLPAGNYWLAYDYQFAGFTVYSTPSTWANALAFSSGAVSFGAGVMPGNMPASISYDSSPTYYSDEIYAVYCDAPTATPTFSNTPTFTYTLTITPTPTNSLIPTNTGTLTDTGTLTPNTFSPTNTYTITLTPTNTITFTITVTPNLSLTPDCGVSAVIFGGTSIAGSPVTAGYIAEMRASLYTMPSDGTIETISLYAPPGNAGYLANVALYTNNAAATTGTTMGTLVAQSGHSSSTTVISPQTLTAGWNVFSIPNSPVTAGDYWLAYTFSSIPVTNYLLVPQYSVSIHSLAWVNSPSSWNFPVSISSWNPSYVPNQLDPIYASYCPGIVYTQTFTPTLTPTLSPTFTNTLMPTLTGTLTPDTPTFTSTQTYSPTINSSLTPDCGASAVSFGCANITPTPILASSISEWWATRYSMPSDGTVETISLYAPPGDAGFQANVAMFANNAATTTMGNLINQSASPQILTGGWNVYKIPNSPVTAGDYWLTYIFTSAPYPTPAYSVVYISSPTPSPNTEAYGFSPPSWTYPPNGATMVPTYTSGYQPIYANYCPGPVNTYTPTNSPTVTPTSTVSNTATNSPTLTITSTATNSPTPTFSMTATLSPTTTPSNTPTLSPTNSPTTTPTNSATPPATPTISPTFTDTMTGTLSPSATFTFTSTFTATNSPTPSLTSSPTPSPTTTPTLSPTNSPTLTPSNSPTLTPTLTITSTFTPTKTGTLSPTFTSTNTPTLTFTNSPTPSFTVSFTPTFTSTTTFTFTPSPTATSTFTPTSTWTSTSTPTITFTPTPGISIAETASESIANINDTITYTITLNVTGGTVSNINVSDILPTHLNLVGFGSIPAGGSTSWNLSTRTATWSFPSLAPGTYYITYTAQVDNNAQQGAVLTNGAQLTYNGLVSPRTTSVNVTMAMTAPTLYPNPIKGTGPANLQVVFSQTQDFVTIKVFTTAFRKVYDDTVKSVPIGTFLYSLDPDNFKGSRAANGLYYVVITTPSNKWVSKLLIFR